MFHVEDISQGASNPSSAGSSLLGLPGLLIPADASQVISHGTRQAQGETFSDYMVLHCVSLHNRDAVALGSGSGFYWLGQPLNCRLGASASAQSTDGMPDMNLRDAPEEATADSATDYTPTETKRGMASESAPPQSSSAAGRRQEDENHPAESPSSLHRQKRRRSSKRRSNIAQESVWARLSRESGFTAAFKSMRALQMAAFGPAGTHAGRSGSRPRALPQRPFSAQPGSGGLRPSSAAAAAAASGGGGSASIQRPASAAAATSSHRLPLRRVLSCRPTSSSSRGSPAAQLRRSISASMGEPLVRRQTYTGGNPDLGESGEVSPWDGGWDAVGDPGSGGGGRSPGPPSQRKRSGELDIATAVTDFETQADGSGGGTGGAAAKVLDKIRRAAHKLMSRPIGTRKVSSQPGGSGGDDGPNVVTPGGGGGGGNSGRRAGGNGGGSSGGGDGARTGSGRQGSGGAPLDSLRRLDSRRGNASIFVSGTGGADEGSKGALGSKFSTAALAAVAATSLGSQTGTDTSRKALEVRSHGTDLVGALKSVGSGGGAVQHAAPRPPPSDRSSRVSGASLRMPRRSGSSKVRRTATDNDTEAEGSGSDKVDDAVAAAVEAAAARWSKDGPFGVLPPEWWLAEGSELYNDFDSWMKAIREMMSDITGSISSVRTRLESFRQTSLEFDPLNSCQGATISITRSASNSRSINSSRSCSRQSSMVERQLSRQPSRQLSRQVSRRDQQDAAPEAIRGQLQRKSSINPGSTPDNGMDEKLFSNAISSPANLTARSSSPGAHQRQKVMLDDDLDTTAETGPESRRVGLQSHGSQPLGVRNAVQSQFYLRVRAGLESKAMLNGKKGIQSHGSNNERGPPLSRLPSNARRGTASRGAVTVAWAEEPPPPVTTPPAAKPPEALWATAAAAFAAAITPRTALEKLLGRRAAPPDARTKPEAVSLAMTVSGITSTRSNTSTFSPNTTSSVGGGGGGGGSGSARKLLRHASGSDGSHGAPGNSGAAGGSGGSNGGGGGRGNGGGGGVGTAAAAATTSASAGGGGGGGRANAAYAALDLRPPCIGAGNPSWRRRRRCRFQSTSASGAARASAIDDAAYAMYDSTKYCLHCRSARQRSWTLGPKPSSCCGPIEAASPVDVGCSGILTVSSVPLYCTERKPSSNGAAEAVSPGAPGGPYFLLMTRIKRGAGEKKKQFIGAGPSIPPQMVH
ncbi:hypothetical protein VOLCADRAFT_88595 [Volvox carteri f. nagariensis]|uniref:Uncharacterized protein n=1 Tax=Volvox carteri f. nagariensis TaxID=3068 RepID=D8TPF2_VOLCA|nr:uncharacterized protein VOLCADRAFT_88595 [Volvox carteri f. nagariensis]EFJ50754.1 hypothetical protein VOLCADRAFT_88595 [Volvox carteri f. nagariensis]|eukprot:XP_002948347.1 hypothetical protein VOLCADRAFT_88595 [Volvox carteri f. nagariensis]